MCKTAARSFRFPSLQPGLQPRSPAKLLTAAAAPLAPLALLTPLPQLCSFAFFVVWGAATASESEPAMTSFSRGRAPSFVVAVILAGAAGGNGGKGAADATACAVTAGAAGTTAGAAAGAAAAVVALAPAGTTSSPQSQIQTLTLGVLWVEGSRPSVATPLAFKSKQSNANTHKKSRVGLNNRKQHLLY